LNEVYVFPQSRSTLDRTFSKVTLWESLEADQAALEFKLARLKKQFNVDHPAILAATDDLLRVYYRSQKSTKAERMSRELLNLYNQILGPKNLKTLHVRLYVINFMIMQGQFPAAQTLAKDLYSDIFDIVQPDHPLALGIMDTQANLAWKLENIETALSLRRQILQIKLASAGLRHTHTIRAMNKLGCLMAGATKNEAEILLRNTIQLLQEDPAGAEEEQCEALGMLAFFQKATGACEESYKVVTEAIERFSLSLGPKHPEIFKLKSELAWNLFVRGKVIESENLFRALDSLYSNGEVEINQAHVANVWAGLDESLLQMGRTAESIGWREKCVDARLSCFGANHSPTATICYYLTDWYELQGQYEDALKLYHRMLDQIRESGMDPHGAIPTLESKILRTEEKMVLSTSNSTISYEESSGYESDSYDGDSAEEGDDESMGEPDEGVDGEVDTQGIGDDEEGGEQEEEDWMTFIRDDIPTS
jgi:tetratricopeptide (TPR) repeat protein